MCTIRFLMITTNPELLVQAQESGNGLPFEPGFHALGQFLGMAWATGGRVELYRSHTTSLVDFHLVIVPSTNTMDSQTLDGPIEGPAVQMHGRDLQAFGELLENQFGTRSARTQLEKLCNVNEHNRALPFADIKRKRKPLKRRPPFGNLLIGLHAESEALVEVRLSRREEDAIWLLIEEVGTTNAVDGMVFVPRDVDADDRDNIAITRVNLFQLIEIFELIEPYMGRRVHLR